MQIFFSYDHIRREKNSQRKKHKPHTTYFSPVLKNLRAISNTNFHMLKKTKVFQNESKY
jgi:hypothetical protein